jgi:hypothetical protein
MELDFQTGALLLLIAAVVAMLTRRLRLPYSVGLVAAGIILAILPFAPKVALTCVPVFQARPGGASQWPELGRAKIQGKAGVRPRSLPALADVTNALCAPACDALRTVIY